MKHDVLCQKNFLQEKKKNSNILKKSSDASVKRRFPCIEYTSPTKIKVIFTTPDEHERSCFNEMSCSPKLYKTKRKENSANAFLTNSCKRDGASVDLTINRKRRCQLTSLERKEDNEKTSYSSNEQERIHKHDESQFALPNIRAVYFGKYELKPWYTSPISLEFINSGYLFVCEYCLDFKTSRETLQRHMNKCLERHPPGNEIFRQNSLSVFEVDGEISKAYCQNLCLLSKLFIDHKSLFYDVEPFLFYVATCTDKLGCHLMGYFSKEKYNTEKNNLSCLLTLPCHQENGIGRFLIDFSFLLTRQEGLVGSPEKPLSDLGILAYRSYWRSTVLEYFHLYRNNAHFSIYELAYSTGIAVSDIIQTLIDLEMFVINNDSSISLAINWSMVISYKKSTLKNKARICINERNLVWQPKIYNNEVDAKRN